MPIKVLLFGQLSELAGRSSIDIDAVADTAALAAKLHSLFPALENMPYRIAVDKKVTEGNILLQDNITVALLPPFSGG